MRVREQRSVEIVDKKATFLVRVSYTEGVNELADIFDHLGVNPRVFDRILSRKVTLPIHAPANPDIEIKALRSGEDSDFVLLRVKAQGSSEAEQLVKNLFM
jgi:hypothetical protein